MLLMPLPEGGLRLVLDADEATMLDRLVTQLIQLLQSHSTTALDPDPLFASLEVGGSDEPPEDPALARLFPDAYEGSDDASEFRRVTEQGLLNRKLQDALEVISAIGLGGGLPGEEDTHEVDVPWRSVPVWARTLTALRLAIAARIGLESEEDHARLSQDEEHRGTVMVFDWLAAILESLLTHRPSDGDDGDDEEDDGGYEDDGDDEDADAPES